MVMRTSPLALLLLVAGLILAVLLRDRCGEREDGASGAPEAVEHLRGSPGLAGARRGEPPTAAAAAPEGQDHEPRPHSHRDWFLSAMVVDSEDCKPIGEATVAVWMEVAGRRTRLAEGMTLADGSLSLDLSALADLSRTQLGCVRLIGHAVAPGYYLRRGAPRVVSDLLSDELQPRSWRMYFRLIKSAVLRGQVLVRGGAPLPQTEITAVPADADVVQSLKPTWEGGGRPSQIFVLTDDEGRYAIPTFKPGEYIVIARRRDIKTKRSASIKADGAKDVLVPPLTVKWLPDKQGTVVFGDGTPVSDLGFEFQRIYISEGRYMWRPDLKPLPVRTNWLGQFTVRFPAPPEVESGPQPNRKFGVRIPGVHFRAPAFDPNADPLRITIRQHRLRLRLRDANGQPLRGQDISFRLGESRWASVDGSTDYRGDVSLFMPNGTHGTVRVARTGNALLTQRVDIPEVGNESVVVIDVPDSPGTGWLRIALGAAANVFPYPVDAKVRTPEGDEVVTKRIKSEADRVALPPGTYRVILRAYRPHRFAKDVPEMASRQRLDDHYTVTDGGTTIVETLWTATAGFALRVTAQGVEPGKMPESGIFLESPTGERRRADLRVDSGMLDPGVHLGRWTYSWFRQRPGSYRLIIEARGYRTVTREIRLSHNELTRVEVEIEREP